MGTLSFHFGANNNVMLVVRRNNIRSQQDQHDSATLMTDIMVIMEGSDIFSYFSLLITTVSDQGTDS